MYINFDIIEALAIENGAARVAWRESEVSESGAIAEIYFEKGDYNGHSFFSKIANVCERMVRIRSFEGFNVCSVPCSNVSAEIRLGWASRGSKLKVEKMNLGELFAVADEIMSKPLYS